MYDSTFFEQQKSGSQRAAECVVPLVLKHVNATSVVDVGCGVGTWLKAFKASGIKNILGMDGDYVHREQLQIETTEFKPFDLRERLKITGRFDLAISLEVAEHLPPERAASFVRDLTLLADVVLFSAAIPFQGGTNHLNEQWQGYWRDLFKTQNYTACDVIRPVIWDNQDVPLWYRQNTLLYVNEDGLKRCSARALEGSIISVVHPEQYLLRSDPARIQRKFGGIMHVYYSLRNLRRRLFADRAEESQG